MSASFVATLCFICKVATSSGLTTGICCSFPHPCLQQSISSLTLFCMVHRAQGLCNRLLFLRLLWKVTVNALSSCIWQAAVQ